MAEYQESPNDNHGTIPGISNFIFRRQAWQPIRDILTEACQRCGRKIYPVERLDVGLLYHRSCFRCFTCGRQLTLQAFQIGPHEKREGVKEVYCNVHVPKQEGGLLDSDALGIRSALDAQKWTRKNQGIGPDKGWQYNPIGHIEGWETYRPQGDRPPGGADGSGPPRRRPDSILEPPSPVVDQPPEPPARPPRVQLSLNLPSSVPAERPRYALARRGTLRSFKDLEDLGIYEAQNELEKLHRQEEDELYQQIFRERREQIEYLENLLNTEQERTVKQLIEFFEQQGISQSDREIMMTKVENFFKKQHDDRVASLLEYLKVEEQAAVGRLIEKHSKEMLLLIEQMEKKQQEEQESEDLSDLMQQQLTMDDMTEPEISPPDCGKEDLNMDPEVFNQLDEQAIKEAQREHETFTDLVRQLSKQCHSDLQRVRALFRWVTVKDLNQMHFDADLDPDSPLGLLRGIKYGTESYHDLFRRLCSYAGIYCEIIEGYSKGAGYRPGSKISGDAFRNQWTAVCVDGSWRFINCNWGARHVKSSKTTNLHYKCDEFYFLTDPDEHIFQHFPINPQWQLLEHPYTFDEYLRLPLLKSPFFNHSLQFSEPYPAVLYTEDGTEEICIHLKESLPVWARVTLRPREGTGAVVPDVTLVRYVGDDVIITAALPKPGKYHLEIFVGEDWFVEAMDNACAFLIMCKRVDHVDRTFPPVGYIGLTPIGRELGFSAQRHSDPNIIVAKEISVTCTFPTNINMSQTLHYWDTREKRLKLCNSFSLLRFKDESTTLFYFRFPKKGMFVFSVYGAPADSNTELKLVSKWLMDCTQAFDQTCAMPTTASRWQHCKLLEPLSGMLPINGRVQFRIASRVIEEMSVFIDGEWQALTQRDQVWSGQVRTRDKPGRAVVYGRFQDGSNKLVPLLEYKIL